MHAARNDGDGATAVTRDVTFTEVGVVDRWFLNPEKIVWRWPYLEDAIVIEPRD